MSRAPGTGSDITGDNLGFLELTKTNGDPFFTVTFSDNREKFLFWVYMPLNFISKIFTLKFCVIKQHTNKKETLTVSEAENEASKFTCFITSIHGGRPTVADWRQDRFH